MAASVYKKYRSNGRLRFTEACSGVHANWDGKKLYQSHSWKVYSPSVIVSLVTEFLVGRNWLLLVPSHRMDLNRKWYKGNFVLNLLYSDCVKWLIQ